MNRRRFLRTAAIGGAGLAGTLAGWTFGWEPHWLEVVERPLPIANLPAALEGKRLVQLSDLHAGPRVSDEYLVESLRLAAGLRPDIVVVTGDLLTHRDERGDGQFAQLRRVLAHLPQGALATLAVLGNHDYGTRWRELAVADRVSEELERAGARVLRNDVVDVAGLRVAGLGDFWTPEWNPGPVLARLVPGAPSLVLCHNPDGVDAGAEVWGGYAGWTLSGHTHGGQCKSPFLPPPLLPVINQRYASGEIPVDGKRSLYISRGIGYLYRVRFNVRPEITAFTLRRA